MGRDGGREREREREKIKTNKYISAKHKCEHRRKKKKKDPPKEGKEKRREEGCGMWNVGVTKKARNKTVVKYEKEKEKE